MTFQEAKEHLSQLAGRRYHSIRYTLVLYGNDSGQRAECDAYIEDLGHSTGPTWESVLAEMATKNLTGTVDMAQAPEVEA